MQGTPITIDELLRFSIFENISTEDMNAIKQYINCRVYPMKTQLITESDPSQCLYFILSGCVKVFLDDEKGKEIVVNQHHENEIVGELGVLQNIPRTASVITAKETRLGVMTEADFKSCLMHYPVLAMNLMQNLVSRLVNATETIRKLGLMDVYGRIAVTLLNLSEEQDGVRVIKEKLTQQTIAGLVGASREMVARILKDLKTGGYIKIDKGMVTLLKSLPHNW